MGVGAQAQDSECYAVFVICIYHMIMLYIVSGQADIMVRGRRSIRLDCSAHGHENENSLFGQKQNQVYSVHVVGYCSTHTV